MNIVALTNDFLGILVSKLETELDRKTRWDLLKPFYDGFNYELTTCAEEVATYESPISGCRIWESYWCELEEYDDLMYRVDEIFELIGRYYKEIMVYDIVKKMSIDELKETLKKIEKYENISEKDFQIAIDDNFKKGQNKTIKEIEEFMLSFNMLLYNWEARKYYSHFFKFIKEMVLARLETKEVKTMKDLDKFVKKLDSYVYLKECCAVLNERNELGLDIDIYDLEEYRDDLVRIANSNNIKVFKIADDYDIDELQEYIVFLENKIINELKDQLRSMYRYDK